MSEKKNSKVTKYPYSIDVQEKFVKALLVDEFNFEDYINLFKPEYFTSEPLCIIAEVIRKYYEKFNGQPDEKIIIQEVSDYSEKNPKIPSEEIKETLNRIIAMEYNEAEHLYVKEKGIDFVYRQKGRNLLLEFAEKFSDARRDLAKTISELRNEVGSFISSEGEEEWKKLEVDVVGEKPVLDPEWLWPNRFPLRSVSLVAGDPGVGKSTLLTEIMARVTTGIPWPDSPDHYDSNQKGSVILLTSEDVTEYQIHPKMIAAKGNPMKLYKINSVKEKGKRVFNLLKDIDKLESLIGKIRDVRLVVVDPINSYMGGSRTIDSYRDTDVREVLDPLADLANRWAISFIGIMHFVKDEMRKLIYKLPGSIGYVGSARAVYGVALNKDDENQRLFFRVKGNYDEPPYTTMTFTIGSVHIAERQAVVPKIEYSPEVLELSLKEIDEMTRTEKAEKKTTEKDKAEEFLKMFLKDSQKRQREIMEAAEKLGISKTTLEGQNGILALNLYK